MDNTWRRVAALTKGRLPKITWPYFEAINATWLSVLVDDEGDAETAAAIRAVISLMVRLPVLRL